MNQVAPPVTSGAIRSLGDLTKAFESAPPDRLDAPAEAVGALHKVIAVLESFKR
jgi:hypothetical protein